MSRRLSLFATTARGTEDLLAEELAELGGVKIHQDRGGVRFAANLDEALRICLWTRIAMRVLYPLGEFASQGAEGLYEAAASVPWEDHLTSESTFMVEATLRNSEHNHSGFVGLKIKDAIADRLRTKLGARPDVDSSQPRNRRNGLGTTRTPTSTHTGPGRARKCLPSNESEEDGEHRGDRREEAARRGRSAEGGPVPADLKAGVHAFLAKNPERSWDAAVWGLARGARANRQSRRPGD